MGTVVTPRLRPVRRIQHDAVIRPFVFMDAVGDAILRVRSQQTRPLADRMHCLPLCLSLDHVTLTSLNRRS